MLISSAEACGRLRRLSLIILPEFLTLQIYFLYHNVFLCFFLEKYKVFVFLFFVFRIIKLIVFL